MKDIFCQQLVTDLIKSKPQTEADVLVMKRKFAKKDKHQLNTNAELLIGYRALLAGKKIKENKILENLLKKRQVRTLSGVAPIAVLTKPAACPGQCLYCPTEKNMPKSYLSNEPAVMRAILCGFDPFKQVTMRIQALEANGHDTDKLELIVMGGTWDYLPEKYRLWFIYACFKAANSSSAVAPTVIGAMADKLNVKKRIQINSAVKIKKVSGVTRKELEKEQKKNEMAKHRIVGLTLETRPDYVTEKSAWAMRELGATRVELGVQHLDDKILKLNKRGALTADTVKATKILRGLGFKITYHMMLNLPGSTPKKDYQMFVDLFSKPEFQPDQIKIYPCVVNQHAELYSWWKQGKYKPYSTTQLKKLLEKIKKSLPYYVRVIRVIRDIPEQSIAAGNKVTNLRDMLNVKCKCIRCREIGHVPVETRQCLVSTNAKLFSQKYKVMNGVEYFFSFESEDRKVLYAFLRLSLSAIAPTAVGAAADNAIIRELHTYGQLVPISGKLNSASQHKGLGKKLMAEAEKIAAENGFTEIAVISGIGVREYYRKLGYKLKDTYMVKEIKRRMTQ